MVTVKEVIRQAFQLILVQDSEGDYEDCEYQDALTTLNNMMAALTAEGLSLGWTAADALTSTLGVADGALEGVISNLALRLAPEYGVPVSPALAQRANNGMRTLNMVGFSVIASALPRTLPTGSGNNTGARETMYFLDQHSAILAGES